MAQKEYKKQLSLPAAFFCVCLNTSVYVCVRVCEQWTGSLLSAQQFLGMGGPGV